MPVIDHALLRNLSGMKHYPLSVECDKNEVYLHYFFKQYLKKKKKHSIVSFIAAVIMYTCIDRYPISAIHVSNCITSE